MKIAVIGPHPDDQELAMGGTIALLVAEGHTVTLVDMTTGEPTPFGTPELRLEESAAAAKILGVQRIPVGLKNREVIHDIPSRHKVAAIYRQLRPDVLFIPYPEDAHPDHLAVNKIASDARFDAKLTKSTIPGEPWYPPRIIHYFCTHLKFSFPATFCIDVTPYMDKKIAAVTAYQSQFFTGRSGAASGQALEYVRGLNRYFGGTINRPYAEPFASTEMMGFSSLNALVATGM